VADDRAGEAVTAIQSGGRMHGSSFLIRPMLPQGYLKLTMPTYG
jgi:hypothetical protein